MPVSIISTTISLPFNQINNKNIDKLITANLKKNSENKCCSHGYIKNDSINIIQRSQGVIKSIDNICYVMYDINYKIDTYLPLKGDVYDCKINNTTKMGSIGYLYEKNSNYTLENSPMLIIIPLDEETKNLNNDDIIEIEVITSKLKYKSSQIQVIGKLNK
jgi:DNA-directed RNA polymerase subunit E'/Rpb7